MGAAEEAMFEPEEKSFWKRHGLLIKMIALLLFAILIVLISLFVNLVINKDDHVCKPGICVKTSADLLKYIDQNVNPCDDFYAFTCGNYLKNSKEVAPLKATEILNSMIAEKGRWSDPPEFTTLQKFYKSCVNLESIDNDKGSTLLQIFNSLGKWPILQGSNWDGRDYYWIDFMIQARQLGLKFEWFLDFQIYQDPIYTSENYLKINVPRYLKPLQENVITARYSLLKDIAYYLGAEEISHFEANATIAFERKLTELVDYYREEDRGDPDSPRFITINEVQALCPNINWLHFINNVTGLSMQPSDTVIFDIQEYINELNKFLQGNPKRLQVDYLMWKIVEEIWPFLGTPIRNRFELYYSQIGANDLLEYNRQKFCVNESKRQFPFVAQSVFIYRNVQSDKKAAVKELVESIRKQMIEFLEDISWTDKEAQKRAINTIYRLNVYAGGPPELYEKIKFYQDIGLSRVSNEITKFLADLNFTPKVHQFKFKSDNVLEMIEERNLARFRQRFSKIGREIDSDRLNFYEKTVNIVNFSSINNHTIVIPAAMLQDTIYNTRLPNYMNYASLGKAVAREMFAMIFDENDWLNVAKVESTTKCLLEQAVLSKTIKVSSPDDLNLAEFLAAELAHDAYLEWAKHHPEEFGMPGFKFTRHQFFWIQASRAYCSKNRNDSVAILKVVNPVRNSYSFAKEFNCIEDSEMHPKEKCRLFEKHHP